MKFSVGYQIFTNEDFINKICEYKAHIYEVYFSWGDFPNGAWAAITYSIGYNASYMVPECIICAALGLLMGKRLVVELRKVK